MAPGMNHCMGGVGPNQVDWMAVLDRWREAGVAPERIERPELPTTVSR